VFRNAQRGTWAAQLRIAGRKVTRQADTQRDAVRALADLRHLRDSGANPERVTVAEWLARWLERKRRDGTRTNTLRGYSSRVAALSAGLGTRTLAALTPGDVEAYTAAMLEAGSAPRTAAHHRAVLANALHDAERDGLVHRNVAALARPPRVERCERVPLSPAQVRDLFAALEDDPWRAVYMLAGTLGLRQGEVLALRWADVDLAAAEVRVRQTVRRVKGRGDVYEPPKSARSARALPLTPVLVAALRDRREHQAREAAHAGGLWRDTGLVFTAVDGGGLPPVSVLRRLYATQEAAGVPRATFHDLRHSAASAMAATGVPPRVAASILGHSHVSTTLDVYTHVLDDAARDAVGRVGESYQPNGKPNAEGG
jgi:integrase